MQFWKSKKKEHEFENYIVGTNTENDLALLLSECDKKFAHYNKDLIKKAFHLCIQGHKNQLRMSGQPYYTHPLEVARIIVNELPMDDISVAAALLHDVVDNSEYSINDIRHEFGDTIADIVDGISQIQVIESYNIKVIESYRKLLVSWFKDARIILIKLADRLHNMRTIEFLDEYRQQKLARETLEIYSPFAHRFGLGVFKWELEDLAFKVQNREEYDKISDAIQLTRTERHDYIRAFIEPIRARLDSNEILSRRKIVADIFGRPKHIYSIFNKTILRDKPIEELYDLFAVRIVLDTDDISTCYIVLGILSEIFRPVPGTFKDYIADPKKNGYQSIHIAVIGMDNKPVEVQIRTRKMHDFSETGFAAHFKYKPGYVPTESILDSSNFDEWVDMVRNIFENYNGTNEENLFQSVKTNFLIDDITVFTPTNECITLPKESTPLDFAYSIHSNIGNNCIGAKVGGKIVPLNHQLKNGDQIEILTSKNQKPEKKWLKYVVTQRAKNSIIKALKEDRTEFLSIGESKWVDMQNDFEIRLTDSDFVNLVNKLKYDSGEEFFVALGKQDVDIEYIHHHFYDKLSEIKRKLIDEKNGNSINTADKEIQLNGNGSARPVINVPITYSECCYPIPGDRIVGEILEDTELRVHRRSCKQIEQYLNPPQANIMNLNWEWLHKDEYNVKFKILAEANDEILPQLTQLMLKEDNIPIRGINFDNDNVKFEGLITITINNSKQLDDLFDKIRLLDGVKKIERFSL